MARNVPRDRIETPDNGRGRGKGATLPAVLESLSHLLAHLERLRQEEALATPPDDDRISVWSDQHHVYIEERLSEPIGAYLDVTLHARTLFIRIEQ
jgi:hypothetical protein